MDLLINKVEELEKEKQIAEETAAGYAKALLKIKEILEKTT